MKNKANLSIIIVTRNRKKELERAMESIRKSTMLPKEIILVDNASNPPVKKVHSFNGIKVIQIKNMENTGAAKGRNIGAEHSTADLLLFMDDDSRLEQTCIAELVLAAKKYPATGLFQPKIYIDEKSNEPTLQGVSHGINLATGRLYGEGINQKDVGQFADDKLISCVGCVWMSTKECYTQLGGYDERFFIPYEDTDFSLRAHKAGYDVRLASTAIVWHPNLKSTFIHPLTTFIGITTPSRAYYVSRNKLLLMSKHSSTSTLLFFCFVLLPIYVTIHCLLILLTGRIDILTLYVKGVIAGVSCVSSALVSRFKIFILAYIEPPVWLLDSRASTILDIGCGDAVPMRMIKSRRQINWSVGVDLFIPYLQIDKMNSTHNRFMTKDVREVTLPDKSFDVVICLQLIEHLKKTEAIKLINKMEKIAKYQVILATPIGDMYHPPVDGNNLQLHHCSFTDNELKDMGYKVYKYGWKWLLGEEGFAHKISNKLIRKLVYGLTIIMTPLMYLFGNYHVYAIKNK